MFVVKYKKYKQSRKFTEVPFRAECLARNFKEKLETRGIKNIIVEEIKNEEF